VVVIAITRRGKRQRAPDPAARVDAEDVLVPFGSPADLERAEARLLG
jgi:K+/H+ antiporter YhaU regulatory subunit KhtT